jgi:hypothetical protein
MKANIKLLVKTPDGEVLFQKKTKTKRVEDSRATYQESFTWLVLFKSIFL